MRTLLALVFSLIPTIALAQTRETWLLTVDRWGNAEHQMLTLESRGDSVHGTLGGWQVAGTRTGGRVEFVAMDSRNTAYRYTGRIARGVMTGTADFPDTNDPAARARHAFTGRRLPDRPAGPPRRVTFEPETFSNEFTAERAPVLVISPGDTVSTRTLDSGGADRDGVTRALYGNPQTGPFFVAGAQPGDVLAIHIHRLRPNRDWAESLDGFAGRAMGPGLGARASGLGQRVRWRLDRAQGVARLETPPAGLADYTVPLRPMLGGLGVAPDFGFAPASAGDSGRHGGNMDYNEIVEGTTVYLPVFRPGALLFLGDGHAAQGDGETTQWALETSLDVEFTVDILPPRPLATPRVESPTHLMVIGQAGSLDDAMRSATAGMAQWLEQDYGLTLSEASMVMGTSIEYEVVTVAGRNAGIAATLQKARLVGLTRRNTNARP
ncbi:acetamidase/formamidase family protein [Longimicrobium terrae]|uniref:Acetamidase/formamidase n=1 Tax=Longimicrobium terrae TaxID=1639882 RepID=A0A841H271_9BACT|nr:acetamidase/formamidase family protein [Longimicrobium terrae]MBB4637671.1 acetamidase/formamidase [Longimicrobium terrae]MBB6072068.1 acetamidase/formamidase [Longimicrobium terrae]NNC29848.1 acetamidase [Longimicrobium terrae]